VRLSTVNKTENLVSEALQKTLDAQVAQLGDRKDEIVDLLSAEQPTKSRLVEMSYTQCTWWEGCYYCRDDAKHWYRIKCFI
jgi:hypothetical protein